PRACCPLQQCVSANNTASGDRTRQSRPSGGREGAAISRCGRSLARVCRARRENPRPGARLQQPRGEQEAEMKHRDTLEAVFSSERLLPAHAIRPSRRGLMLASLIAALPLALSDTAALAGKIDPVQTQVTLPDAIEWSGWIKGFPPDSGEMAPLYGGLDKPGPYLVLMKWYRAT